MALIVFTVVVCSAMAFAKDFEVEIAESNALTPESTLNVVSTVKMKNNTVYKMKNNDFSQDEVDKVFSGRLPTPKVEYNSSKFATNTKGYKNKPTKTDGYLYFKTGGEKIINVPKFVVTYDSCYNDITNSKYSLRITVNSMKIELSNAGYHYVRVFGNFNTAKGSIQVYSADKDFNRIKINTVKSAVADIKMELLDKSGSVVDGTFAFGLYDVDRRGEGIKFKSGFDDIKINNKTNLTIDKSNNMIYASGNNTKTSGKNVKTMISATASSKCEFEWHANCTCGTVITGTVIEGVNDDRFVLIRKVDAKGNRIEGAQLAIYDANGVLQRDGGDR